MPAKRARAALALCLGSLSGLGLVVVLLLALFLRGRDKLASNWELQRGALGYLPLWLLLLCSLGALGGLLASEPAERRSMWRELASARGLCFGLYGLLVGWGVGGGRHLQAPSLRFGFALLVGMAACLGLGLWYRALFALARRGLWQLASASSALLALLAELTNGAVLVRLYPAFHLGLSVLAIVWWGGAWALARPARVWLEDRAVVALRVVGILLLISAGLVVPALRSLERFDNFRWVLLETSPTLGVAVQLGAHLARPSAVTGELPAADQPERDQSTALDWRGRSVLLVTVDALRADHVGVYGYQRGTTPHLDELAAGGVTFEAAYAPTPHTSYSVLSLMTGKYMRPLLLQGVAEDSDLWATLLRTYGYKTAAFYPPAVFFIDQHKFRTFEQKRLGFEYFKVEFAEGELRRSQVQSYLRGLPPDGPLFLWLHLFGPHEPYEARPTKDFGPADVDRYDSEIAEADETLGFVTALMRKRDPNAVVIVTADHGEEFGDHGGRYHGTTLYEEQVRVPLVVSAPGLPAGRRVQGAVQTIDLLPTVLGGMDIPVPPRLRGRDLGADLMGSGAEGPGLALAETDELSLLAEGRFRLICHRPSGACRLFDLATDPGETKDVSADHPRVFEELKGRARALSASHGRFEAQGLRREGKGWPAPIVRGLAGDADAAPELSQLLEDADREIRAKAAEVLLRLATSAEAPALRLALAREEDAQVRAWLALALTRLGQAAPLVQELLTGPDPRLRRLAALALGLSGDDAGEDELIAWWSAPSGRSHEEDLEILAALGRVRSKAAVGPLLRRLPEVRLRVQIADTLAKIGDKDARPWLSRALVTERYHPARIALGRALLELGAEEELIVPLRHFLGVPDVLPGGLGLAGAAGILNDVGGPEARALGRLRQLADSGVDVSVVVPPLPSRATPRLGARIIVRAKAGAAPGRVHVAPLGGWVPPPKDGEGRLYHQPDIRNESTVTLEFSPSPEPLERCVALPEAFGARPGLPLRLAVFAEGGVKVDSLAVVPLRQEVPPPPPEPWEQPAPDAAGEAQAGPPR